MSDDAPTVPLIPSGKFDGELDSTEEALFSRIPLMTSPRKMSYLGYRASGFSVREACDLVPISFRTLLHWREADPEFKAWEMERLAELQSTIADDLLKFDFLRNMKMVLRIDGRLFERRLYNPGEMTPDDRKDYREASKRYSAQDLVAIERALTPERFPNEPEGGPGIQVFVDGDLVVTEAAERAASRSLLERFAANRRMIEAEVREVPAMRDTITT